MTTIYETYEEVKPRKSIKKKIKKTVVGLLLLVIAAAWITNKLGLWGNLAEGITVWSIIFSVLFLTMLIDGLIDRSFGQILFSLAFLVIANDKLLGMEAITPWPVLGAALLGTIGLNILFPSFHKKYEHRVEEFHDKEVIDEEKRNGDRIYFKNSFGTSVKYLSGEISEVNIDSSFGSMQVYFTDVILKDNAARVNLSASFGDIKFYVPADWKVLRNEKASFGNANEKGHCNPEGTQILYVDGNVNFGNLTINYV